jgi:hypothetical protein
LLFDLEDKKGHPGSMKVGPGFFMPGPLMKPAFKGTNMTRHELAHLKETLLLVKDWDGFQMAMRRGLLKDQTSKKVQRREIIQ